jgi:uracil-DNA glycosylase
VAQRRLTGRAFKRPAGRFFMGRSGGSARVQAETAELLRQRQYSATGTSSARRCRSKPPA